MLISLYSRTQLREICHLGVCIVKSTVIPHTSDIEATLDQFRYFLVNIDSVVHSCYCRFCSASVETTSDFAD